MGIRFGSFVENTLCYTSEDLKSSSKGFNVKNAVIFPLLFMNGIGNHGKNCQCVTDSLANIDDHCSI